MSRGLSSPPSPPLPSPPTNTPPPHSFTKSQTGLTFLGVGLGVVLAGLTAVYCDLHFYQPAHRRTIAAGHTSTPPETRLYVSMLGCFGVPIGIFWFAWTARADVHWASCVVAAVPFAWGNLCVFVSSGILPISRRDGWEVARC